MKKFALIVNEAAEYTGIGKGTLRNHIQKNILFSVSVGSKNVIIVEELEQLLCNNRGKDLLHVNELQPVNQQEKPA